MNCAKRRNGFIVLVGEVADNSTIEEGLRLIQHVDPVCCEEFFRILLQSGNRHDCLNSEWKLLDSIRLNNFDLNILDSYIIVVTIIKMIIIKGSSYDSDTDDDDNFMIMTVMILAMIFNKLTA